MGDGFVKKFGALLVCILFALAACSSGGSDDTDGDGLKNDEEAALGTDPDKVDTDDDGVNDKDEQDDGTDPLQADSDDDGFDDGEEKESGTDPTDPEDVPDTGAGNEPRPDETPAEGGAISVVSDVTCHNRNTAGGRSDQDVEVQTDLPEGNEIILVYEVISNGAPDGPQTREGSATVGADGSATVAIPLFAPGEVLRLSSAETADGSQLVIESEHEFTVAPLDEPDCP